MDAGYTVLKVTKDDGAYIYASGAYDDATGATGAGGHLYPRAFASGWTDVRFVNIVGAGLSMPVDNPEITYPTTLYKSTGTVIQGVSGPTGDIRGEGTGYYVGIGSAPSTLPRNTTYSGAIYAIYEGTHNYTGKVGIGISSPSSYYEGEFTTKNLYEFASVFNVDTGDLVSVTTGSGVHRRGDVTLQFGLGNPVGGTMTSSAAIAQDPFISGQKISILDINGGLVFPNYRVTTDSIFNFTVSQNADVFGTYTKDFGVRNDVVNYDGTTQRSEFYLYGNDLYIDNVSVKASGATFLNQSDNTGNFSPRPTGGLSQENAAEAVKYFNNQKITGAEGISGQLGIQVSFENDPTYTDYGNLAIFAGTEENFETNEGSLLSLTPLQQIQKGQHFPLFSNDGIPENTGLYLKLAVDTPEATTSTLYTYGPVTIERIPHGGELFVANAGDQTIDGCLDIYCLSVSSGNATGTGDGGRLTGPGGLPYLLTGDSTEETQTLQKVTEKGSTTTIPTTYGGPLAATAPLTVVTEGADDGGVDIYDHGDTTNAIVTIGGDAFAAGLMTLRDTLAKPSVELGSDTAKAGQVNIYNPDGDTEQVTLSVDANGGVSKAKDTDGNDSAKMGSDANKRGYTVVLNPDGTEERGRLGASADDMGYLTLKDDTEADSIKLYSDSSKNAIIEATDAAGSKLVNIDTNSSNDSYLNLPSVGIGTSAVESTNSFEVYSPDASATILSVGVGTSAGYVGVGTSNPQFPFDASNVAKANIGAANSKINSTGSAILGGANHQISGDFDVIAGGIINNISGGDFNFIGGGSGIDVTGSDYSSSMGGYNNDILSSDYATIAGGYDNLVSGAAGGVLGGGFDNTLKATNSVIVGGQSNTIHEGGIYSFIGAGGSNVIRGQNNVIAGGINHEISGDMAVIMGGSDNKIEADRGVVGGNHSYVQAGHTGAFVFSDSSTTPALSSGTNTLGLHFEDGVYVESTSGLYLNGIPVMTGVNPYDEDTLQTVTDRGNTTTNSILSTGPHISGVTGLFSDRVGIGTSAPSELLHLQDSSLSPQIRIDGGDGSSDGAAILGLYEQRNGQFGFKFKYDGSNNRLDILSRVSDVDTARLTIDRSLGYVGIGTDAPARTLAVEGTIQQQDPANSTRLSRWYNDATAQWLGPVDARPSYLMAHNTPWVTIETDGSVGIGANWYSTTGPLATLDVRGDISGSGSFLGTGVGNRITNNGTPYLLSGDSPAETQTLQDVCNNGNTTTGSIAVHGQYLSGVTGVFESVDITGTDTLTVTGKVGIGINDPSGTLHIYDTGASPVDKLIVDGSNGRLFNVADTLTGIIFSVNDAAGLPILEAESTSGFDRITMGEYGTNALVVSGNKVGIGTATPSYKLDVNGDVGGTGLEDRITLNGTGYLLSGDVAGEADTLQTVTTRGHTTSTSILSTGPHISGVTGLYSDNVGIGTATPDDALTIVGTSADFSIRKADNNLAARIVQFSAGGAQLRLYDSGSNEQIRLAGDGGGSFITGNVGIGITNPNKPLQVVGGISGEDIVLDAGNSSDMAIQFAGSNNGIYCDPVTQMRFAVDSASSAMVLSSNHIQFGAGGHSALSWSTNNYLEFNGGGTKARLNSVGLGVGTTDPITELDVRGDISGSGDFLGTGVGNRITNNGTPYLLSGDSPAETQTLQDVCNNGNTTTGSIAVQGQYLSGVTGVFESVDITGTDTLTVTGNVGIGTNSPAARLEVIGTDTSSLTNSLLVKGNDENAKFEVNNQGQITINSQSDNAGIYFQNTATTRWAMYQNGGGLNIQGQTVARFIDIDTSSRIQNGDNGNVVFSMGGAFDDASNKYYGFVTDIDNVSSAANSAIADFRVGSASKVFFDINGYVGIGTTAPLATLDVRGDISGSGSFLGTGVGNRITNNGTPYLLSGDAAAALTLQDVCDNGSTTTTSITSSGPYISGVSGWFGERVNVGASGGLSDGSCVIEAAGNPIGATSRGRQIIAADTNPLAAGVGGGIDFYGVYTVGGDRTQFGGIRGFKTNAIGAQYGGGLKFYTREQGVGTEERLTILESGNVGIGTDAPTSPLEVKTTFGGDLLRLNTTSVGDLLFSSSTDDGRSVAKIATTSSSLDLKFHSSSARSYFQAGQVVGIGTYDPQSQLQVIGTGLFSENVGIGTDTPNKELHVVGDIWGYSSAPAGTGDAYSVAGGSALDGNTRMAGLRFDRLNDVAKFGCYKNSSLIEEGYIAITSGGLVGIGTDAPTEALEVAGDYIIVNTDSSYGGVRIKNGGTTRGYLYGDGNGISLLDAYGSYAITVDNGGDEYVGIGTRDPSYKLHVSGDVAGTGLEDRITLNGTGYLLSGDVAGEADTLQTVTTRGHTTSTSILSTGPHISGISGLFGERVGIGTSAPTNNLHIVGTMQLDNSVSDAFKIRLNGAQGLAYDHDSITSTNAGYDITIAAGKELIFKTYDGGFNEAMRIDTDGNVGIGTDSPQADLHVSGSGIFGIIGYNTPNSTVTVAGYDDFGLDFRAHGSWTHWKARVGHGRNFELYNDGSNNQKQVLELGKTTKGNASVYVRSTGAFIEAGMNAATSIPVVSMGCLADSDHLGGAYLDVRDAVASTHRYEFNRDGTFVASGVSVSGDVAGTGVGDRITLNGTPYLLSGDAASALTLQDVCDNGNTTTGSIISSGPHISGVTGLFSDAVGIGTTSPTSFSASTKALHLVGTNAELKVETNNGGGWAFNHYKTPDSDWLVGADNDDKFRISSNGSNLADATLTIETGGHVGIGTTNPDTMLQVYGGDIKLAGDETPSQPFTLKARYGGLWMIGDGSATNEWMMANLMSHDYAFHFKYTPGTIGATGGIMKMGQQSKNSSTYTHGITAFYTDGAERLRIDGVGNVGIGTDDPLATLDVRGDISGSGSFLGTGVGNRITNNHVPYLLSGDSPAETQTLQDVCNNGNTTTGSIAVQGQYLSGVTGVFETVDITGAATLTVSGNVGIGTTDPSYNLDFGTGAASTIRLVSEHDGTAIRVGAGQAGGGDVTLLRVDGGTTQYSGVSDSGNYGFSLRYMGSRSSYDNGLSIFSDNAVDSDQIEALTIIQDGKVGIGSTSPAYTLDVVGNASISSNLTTPFVYAVNGFGSDGSNFIYFNSASDYAKINTNGVERMRINSVGDVGIGTTAPSGAFHVVGGGGMFDVAGASTADHHLTVSEGTPTDWRPYAGSTTAALQIQNSATRGLLLAGKTEGNQQLIASDGFDISVGATVGSNDGDIALSISGDGNVGIGTTIPIGDLQVGANTFSGLDGVNSNSRIGFSLNGSLTSMVYASTYNDATYPDYGMVFIHGDTGSRNVWSISPDGPAKGDGLNFIYGLNATNIHTTAPKVVFKGDGKVGIGTDAPSDLLDVVHYTSPAIRIEDLTNNVITRVLSDDNKGRIGTFSNNDFSLYSNSSERMVITSAGNVGIGTTAPTEKLDVRGDVFISGATFITEDGTSDTTFLTLNSPYTIGANVNYVFEIGDTALGANAKNLLLRGSSSVSDIVFSPSSAATGLMHLDGSSARVGINKMVPSYALDVYGDVGGTGAGDRITLNGIPYLLSGDSPAETQTLQQVCDNDNSTTTDITISDLGSLFVANRVGIGTVSPTTKVHITGDTPILQLTESAGDNEVGISLNHSTNGEHYNWFVGTLDEDPRKLTIGATVTNGWSTDTAQAAASLFAIKQSNGNVGIGSTDPYDKLEVYANGADVALRIHEDAGTHEAKLHLRRGGNDWEIINNSDLAIEIEGTEVFRIDTDGNVGIGTTDPQYYKLHLNDADTSTLAIQCNGNNATGSKIRLIEGSANFLGAYMHYDGDTNKFNLGVHNTSNTTLADDTAAITIDRETAYVGIGSTSPTVELDVASTDFDGSMKWTQDLLRLHNTGDKNQIIVGCKANSPTGSYLRLTEGPTTISQGGYIQYDGLNNNLNIGVNDGGTAFTDDVAALTIDRTTAYVGIGLSDPDEELEVRGSMKMSDPLGELVFANTSSTKHTIGIYGNNDLLFKNGSSQTNLSILYGGNVGIGTTAPLALLDVRGDISGSGDFLGTGVGNRITNNGTPYLLSGDSPAETQTLQDVCNNGNTTTGSILSTGPHISGVTGLFSDNVGIGTTVPLAELHVHEADAGAFTFDGNADNLIVESNGNGGITIATAAASDSRIIFATPNDATSAEIKYSDANNLMTIGPTTPSNSLVLQAGNGAEAMRIDSAGNVGIGTTSPTVELDVVGTGIFSSKVGIGTTPTNALDVNGHLSATSKSFLIDHPTKENKKLQYASLEGPEHAVYVRGTHNSSLIELPEYWSELVHQDSITVLLTPLGKHQNLYVKSKDTNHISVGGVKGSYDYIVYGERKDIDKLEVEL